MSATNRPKNRILCAGLAVALLSAGLVRAETAVQAEDAAHVRDTYRNLSLKFESNQGQTDPAVKFFARGKTETLFLTATEAVLRLNEADAAHSVLRMKIVNGSPNPDALGVDALPGRSNFFVGKDASKWRANVVNYAKVRYEGVYPGIGLVYYGHQRDLEYDFVLAPGADPTRIRMAIQGADRMELDARGDVVLVIGGAQLRLRKPYVYQEENGRRKQIVGEYVRAGQNEVVFRIGPYDDSKRLVIDPVLEYATYLGGSGDDITEAIAVDSDGYAYIAGTTFSTDFPGASGIQGRKSGSFDAFIAKLNPSGSALVYSTYLGGTGEDGASGIAVDGNKNVYIGGYTWSEDFPVVNAVQRTFGGKFGNTDAFAAKLDATGSRLLYSTYLGGQGYDTANGIAVDAAGNAYVVGSTSSVDFPTTANAYQPKLSPPQFGGGTYPPPDAFIVKLNPAGSFVYSTFLGGNSTDGANAIAVDSAGNAYITGIASASFPLTNPSSTSLGYSSTCFAAKLNPDGSALLYSTFVSASGDYVADQGYGIAVDSAGNAYVAGSAHPTQDSHRSVVLVSKLNPTGSAAVYTTNFGGSLFASPASIAVDPDGRAYVAGYTSSMDFPAIGSLQLPSGRDTFVVKLSPDGAALVFSTFLPGLTSGTSRAGITPSSFPGMGMSLDRSGNVYLARTAEFQSTLPVTMGAIQIKPAGGTDAFASKLSVLGRTSQPALTSISPAAVAAGSLDLTVVADGSNFLPNSVVLWNGSPRTTTFVGSTRLEATIGYADVRSGGFASISVFNPGGSVSNPLPFRIENPSPTANSLSLSPTTQQYRDDFSLTVEGSNFAASAVLEWNGDAEAMDPSSSSQRLIASIPRSLISTTRSPRIRVVNPGPGGGGSVALTLDLSPPVIGSVTPSRLSQGSRIVTVTGSNFNRGSTVQWNGSNRPTTFISTSGLTATLESGDVNSARIGNVMVWNASLPQGLSNVATVTIVGNPGYSTASLEGVYVFSMAGYDISGPVALAGRFAADGAGKITSGKLDRIDVTGLSSTDVSGSYSVGSSGEGFAQISTAQGGTSFNFVMLSGSSANIVEMNQRSVTSGTIEKQDSAGATNLPGAYVFSLRGVTPSGWMAAAGRFSADGSGAISDGAEDLNDTGQVLRNSLFTGTYTLDSTGRGIATLTGSAGTSSLIFYIVSARKLVLLSASGVPIVTGEAEKQDAISFSSSSLSGGYGLLADGLTALSWDVFLGRFNSDGRGGISGGLLDRNSSGALTEDTPFTGTYQASPNGRGEIVLDSVGLQGAFYLVSAHRAKFVQLDTASAVSGTLEAQQGTASSPDAWLGPFGYLQEGSTKDGPVADTGIVSSDGAGNLHMTESVNASGGLAARVFDGTYEISPGGKGRARIQSSSGVSQRNFVVLSESRLMIAVMDPTAALAGYADLMSRSGPTISDSGIVSGANFAPVAPVAGMVASIFGDNLSGSTQVAASLPLPTTLAGVEISVDDVAAPLFFVSPNQINFQVPWDNPAPSRIILVRNNVFGDERHFNGFGVAPGVFTMNQAGTGQGAIVISSTGELAASVGSIPARAARPAHRGEFISIYCTGLGSVNNPPGNGAPASTETLSLTPRTPIVNIGGQAAWVVFSGLAPGYVGLYQVNVQVPPNAQLGDAVPVQIISQGPGSVPSLVVTMAVQQ